MKKLYRNWLHRSLSFVVSVALLFIVVCPYVQVNAETSGNSSNQTFRMITDEEYYPEDYIGYKYPVRPGTSQWSTLTDHQEKINACMIPTDILAEMSTEELIQSIMCYPLISDIFAYDDWSVGLTIVSNHFNGFDEFKMRSDAASSLVDLYVNSEPLLVNHVDQETLCLFENPSASDYLNADYEACRSVLYSMVLNTLLGCDMYISDISTADVQKLLSYGDRLSEDNSVYFVQQPNSVISATGILPTATSYSYLYQVGYTAVAYSAVPLTTPGGKSVEAFTTACMELWLCSDGELRPYEGRLYADLPAAYITTLNNEHYDTYGLSPISSPTVKYNCHSYAWYLQSTTNNVWIDDPTPYLTDGCYSVVNKMNTQAGDKVVYYYSVNGTFNTPSHSAVIVSYTDSGSQRSFVLKSKWGMSGLYQHSLTNCPYYYFEGPNYTSIHDTRFYSRN